MTTKLTKAQTEVMEEAISQYEMAQNDFEYWFMHSSWMNSYEHNYESFEEAVEDHYRFFAKRDHRNDQEAYIKSKVENARETYEMFRSGIIHLKTSSNTIRALEKKGLIEIIKDGGWMFDTVKLLNV